MKTFSVLSRMIALAVCLCLCAAFIPVMTFATETDVAEKSNVSVYDGTVSEDLRHSADGLIYYIDSAADLAKFSSMVNEGNTFAGKTVYLTTDISWNENDSEYLTWSTTAPANSWAPIGEYTKNFAGTFDGLGHTISGLYYAGTKNIFAGLFGYVAPASGDVVEIRNISVTNSYFKGDRIGGIISFVRGTGTVRVKNAYVSAVMQATQQAGGIVSGTWVDAGVNTIEIDNCAFDGTLSTTATLSKWNGYVGGIIGVASATTTLKVTNCLNLGTLSSTNGVSGGIFGGFTRADDSTVIPTAPTVANSINLGTVSGKYAGEIYGSMQYKLSTSDFASAEKISNNIYDGSKLICGDDSRDAMSDMEIKALGNDALATLGFTGWTSSTLNGTKVPLPTTVATMLSQENGQASLWDGTVDTNLRQDGNTYYIDTAAQLAGFAQNVNNGTNYSGETVYLTTDIVWNENNADYLSWTAGRSDLKPWPTIGVYSKEFKGTFDGQGHTISGLYCATPYPALFGYATNATIQNVSVENSAFIGQRSGAIVAFARGTTTVTVRNCYASAKVEASLFAGGILGGTWTDASPTLVVENCVFDGIVKSTSASVSTYQGYAGGIVGAMVLNRTNNSNTFSTDLTISNCLNLGTVEGKAPGGIFGGIFRYTPTTETDLPVIKNCINLGSATNEVYGSLFYDAAQKLSASDEKIINNLYGSGEGSNFGMNVSDIKALSDVQLTEKGFTAWVSGENYPLPSVVSSIFDGTFAANTVNEVLDDAIITNYYSKNDILNPLFANCVVTVTNPATVDSEGSLTIVVPLENTTVERTLTIPKLPVFTYAFDGEEKGIATGTVTATFESAPTGGHALAWGTANGLLDGYRALAQESNLQINGNVLTYEIADRVAIPLGATHLWLTVDGIRLCAYEIPANLRPAFGTEKYTFGILSDVHFGYSPAPGSFALAMDDFRANNVAFVVTAGDFTSAGEQAQYDIFASSYANYSDIPLFTTVGNHDTLDWNVAKTLTTKTAILNMIANVETFANESYTGKNGEFKVENSDAYGEYVYDYTVTYGDDLFIYLGIGPNEIEEGLEKTDPDAATEKVARYVSEAQLTWLRGVLANSEDYQNVILMFHYPLKQSGIPLYDRTETFDELSDVLKDYPNVIHFSGHTHNSFADLNGGMILSQTQKFVNENGTYVSAENDLGYTAVHVPSNYDKQTGYIATVYESGTLLTGYDFANNQVIPYATFFVANEEPIKEANVDLSATVNGGKDTEVQLLDKDGNLIETVTSVGGVATFTTLTLEDGVYTYTVKQNATNGGGWFYDANEYTITVTVADGVATIDGEAVFTNTDRVPFAEGKIENGKYVVTETGKATEMGLIKIGEDYYYAGPNGVLVTGKYYAWRLNENCDIEKGWYYFDAYGKLVNTGIADGCYYENGKPTEKGLIKIGEDYYYAGPNGKLVSDQRYYAWKADEKCDLPTAWYWFDETGRMIGSSAEGEIVEINGVKYFYRSGKPTEMGLFEYEGNYYVAQYDGMIITSENYTKYGPGKYYVWKADGVKLDKGYWRYFDAEGKMIGASSEGEIVTINGVKYYYVHGAPKEMGLFEYEGNYYVAQYDGKIITDKKYYVWKVDSSASEIGTGWFNFGADGKLVK